MSVWFRSLVWVRSALARSFLTTQSTVTAAITVTCAGVISGPSSPWSSCSCSLLTAHGWEGPRNKQDLRAGFTLLSGGRTLVLPVRAGRVLSPEAPPVSGRTVTSNCSTRAQEHRRRAELEVEHQSKVFIRLIYFITPCAVYSLQWLQGNWISFVLLAK